jgi:hypothetical protein
MQQAQAEFLAGALEFAGFDAEASTYSGRGMYGEETHAVTGDFALEDVLQAVMGYLVDILDPSAGSDTSVIPDIRNVPIRTDSMGRGIVVY